MQQSTAEPQLAQGFSYLRGKSERSASLESLNAFIEKLGVSDVSKSDLEGLLRELRPNGQQWKEIDSKLYQEIANPTDEPASDMTDEISNAFRTISPGQKDRMSVNDICAVLRKFGQDVKSEDVQEMFAARGISDFTAADAVKLCKSLN